jgi:paraquat-inducible protein A
MGLNSMIACHDCDLIQKIPSLPEKGTAKCIRCGAVLYQHKPDSLDRTIALTVAGLVLFIVANSFPFLAMKTGGLVRETTLATGIHELYGQEMWEMATLVLLTCLIIPLVQMSCMLYLLVPIKLNRSALYSARVFRFVQHLAPWGMMEVFMLGILVSLVKLGKMATIVPGLAAYSFGLLIFILAASSAALDPHIIWEKLEVKQ